MTAAFTAAGPFARSAAPRRRAAGPLWSVVNSAAALLMLLLALPVVLGVALAVKLDGGPMLFRQERVGKDGRDFPMLKFRSMVVDAEARLAALGEHNEGSGPLFKLRHDPRVTRVGAVLRKYSLDELPQLLNVVAGQMALVGPRPALRREVEQYCAIARRRLAVKPGLTGLWQVSGRSDLNWEESIALDAEYVATWSPMLDAKILARTAAAVVRGGGAY
ncbi:sugar transferase [Pseudonocardia oroxyli]|uniref:Sugar transferase involved in LPS biosynthesis (Colanic, teichoic acid) n=1 Tax=Pseudonocardia oroxyli TaxID=366584 RepID=A0A1G7ZBH7_PSEOR|nr:Sugar transferase involved in LPS biosynthesis (colanic, teichoic acid) [Pseudonocardia oroxyli]